MVYPRFTGGQPQFMTSVPFTEAYRAGEQRSEQRRAADLASRTGELNLQNAERQAQQQQAVDAALRGAITQGQPAQPMPSAPGAPGEQPGTELAPGGGMRQIGGGAMTQTPTGAPVPQAPAAVPPQAGGITNRAMTALAQTPGGGQAAFALAQQQEKERDQAETRMMERLGDGDVQGGMYWANKAGINPPQELVGNATFWQGAKMAKQFYGEDMEKGHRFAQAYVTAQGDPMARMQAGLQQAGPPVNRTAWATITMADGVYQVNPLTGMRRKIGDAYRAPQMITGQDGNLYSLTPGQTQVQPITAPGGDQFKGSKFGASASGGVYDFIAQKLMAEDPGLTYQEAIGLARRANNGDQYTLQRERLALQGAKQDRNFRRDPAGTLARWRQQYGLPPDPATAPATPGAPGAPAPAPAAPIPGDKPAVAQQGVASPAAAGTVGLQPVAVPPDLASEPDGTIIRDDETGQEYEKQGDQLIPR